MLTTIERRPLAGRAAQWPDLTPEQRRDAMAPALAGAMGRFERQARAEAAAGVIGPERVAERAAALKREFYQGLRRHQTEQRSHDHEELRRLRAAHQAGHADEPMTA